MDTQSNSTEDILSFYREGLVWVQLKVGVEVVMAEWLLFSDVEPREDTVTAL